MTEPVEEDFFIQLGYGDDLRERVSSACKELGAEGATWAKLTCFDEHGVAVLQGWRVRPVVEAEAHPALTYKEPAQ